MAGKNMMILVFVSGEREIRAITMIYQELLVARRQKILECKIQALKLRATLLALLSKKKCNLLSKPKHKSQIQTQVVVKLVIYLVTYMWLSY